MKCANCNASQEPDSNFCDQCGEPLQTPQAPPSPSPSPLPKVEVQPTQSRSHWEKVLWTQDIGEQAFVQTLMENEGIPCRPTDEFAERYSLWSNPFFRTFTLSVPAKYAGRARRVLKKHETLKPESTPSPLRTTLALTILAIFAAGLFIGLIGQIRG